jgi:predicted transposase/invertase (TIGR01784 family)
MKTQKKCSTPHDRIFKSGMQHLQVAQEFLKLLLPENFKQAIDFSQLKIQKDTFVDKYLQLKESDILYSSPFKNHPGKAFFLIEHQSTIDPKMSFRIHQYQMNIMDLHLKSGNKKLPIIYPLIVYTGEKSYNASTNLFDLFDAPKELIKPNWNAPIHLIESKKLDDKWFSESIWAGSLLKIMKYTKTTQIWQVLKSMHDTFQQLSIQNGMDFIYTLVNYIYETTNVSLDEFESLIFSSLPFNIGEKVMSFEQAIKEAARESGFKEGKLEGRLEGRLEGKLEGRLEGKLEGEIEGKLKSAKAFALLLLKDNVPKENIIKWTGLTEKELEELS